MSDARPAIAPVSWRCEPGRDAAVPAAGALLPDTLVLRLVERRDYRGALQQMMQSYSDDVYRYCHAMLNDPALADEVRQQTFVEAYRDLPRFRRSSSIKTWLFAIARHRTLDATKCRRRACARTCLDDVAKELADTPDPQPSPAESIDALRLREALRASLDELAAPVRKAIVLRYHDGLTFEQIAAICGGTPGTHHARVARALPVLRRSLESRIGDCVPRDLGR